MVATLYLCGLCSGPMFQYLWKGWTGVDSVEASDDFGG